jgi:hypothetical protein
MRIGPGIVKSMVERDLRGEFELKVGRSERSYSTIREIGTRRWLNWSAYE